MAQTEWLYSIAIKVRNDDSLQIGLLERWELSDGKTVRYGRTWEGLGAELDEITGRKHTYIYVGDLTQFYQFAKTTYDIKKVFYIRNREVLYFSVGEAVFRSVSLLGGEAACDFVSRKLGVNAAGLTESEALWQAVKAEAGQRSVRSLPLTKTGYLRRILKTAKNKKRVKRLMADNKLVRFLYLAMRGGNTVCNHWRTNTVIENVKSWDITSAYLAAMYFKKFPVGEFVKVNEPWQNKAWVAKVKIKGLLLRHYLEPAPYIAIGRRQKWLNHYSINGRIVGASEAIIYITDVDYQIIESQYQWESFEFLECFEADYDYLPVEITDLVLDLFFDKERAKAKKLASRDYYKTMANAIFGISVQSPFTPTWQEYMPDPDTVSVKLENIPEAEQIARYLDKMAILPYQWGVWTSAHIRAYLQKEIERAGADFIYSDTDCIKTIGEYEPEGFLGDYELSFEDGAYKSILGGWREEATAKRFKMLGSKRYCAELENSVDLVLAGCQKERATAILMEKGGFEAFRPGLVLEGCGGIIRQYNDTCLGWKKIDGKVQYVPSNTYDTVADYTIGQADSLEDMFKKQDFILYSE